MYNRILNRSLKSTFKQVAPATRASPNLRKRAAVFAASALVSQTSQPGEADPSLQVKTVSHQTMNSINNPTQSTTTPVQVPPQSESRDGAAAQVSEEILGDVPLVKVEKVLVVGSGGLSIGQAGEFDYSGK